MSQSADPVGAVESAARSALNVRIAAIGDVQAVAAGVGALLEELGGASPGRSQLVTTARALIADANLGCVLVGEAGAAIVGLLAVSWQTAIHAGGRYALIQDLWVAPAWRRGGLGAKMMLALVERAHGQGISRIEVGLPVPRLAGGQGTEAFYVRNGFRTVGPRMRLEMR